MTTEFCIASGDRGGRKPAATNASTDISAGPAGSSRILVVEDEWFISMEIEAILAGAGYEVVGVATAVDDAIGLADQHRPDLVLMDIRLRGDGDGIAAAAEIRRRFGLRSIFVSAHTDPATRERAEPAEPLGWVVKPFSDGELLAAVRDALGSLSA